MSDLELIIVLTLIGGIATVQVVYLWWKEKRLDRNLREGDTRC